MNLCDLVKLFRSRPPKVDMSEILSPGHNISKFKAIGETLLKILGKQGQF